MTSNSCFIFIVILQHCEIEIASCGKWKQMNYVLLMVTFG